MAIFNGWHSGVSPLERERERLMGLGAGRISAVAGTAAVAGLLVLSQAGAAVATPSAGQGSALAGFSSQPQVGATYHPLNVTLRFGDHGPAVKALQRRLNFLHYYAGPADGVFGWDTQEAVWAFKEVQSRRQIPPDPNPFTVKNQHQLVDPKLPPVLHPHAAPWRIEVNKAISILVVYRHNEPILISHTSSAAYYRPDGTGWVTPDGRYRALGYYAGCVPDSAFGGCMYNPVFFIGSAFAIHGMPNPTSTFSGYGVPLNPASHGCIRIPLDISVFLHKLIRVEAVEGVPTGHLGTPIYVNGPNYYGNGAFQ
jgi:peptidoglycan hydrolase-like protein with peptidoglycan-binding domain